MKNPLNPSEIKKNNYYGILTWGGAASGLWEIAKIVSVGKIYCTYLDQMGPSRFEKRRCKLEDVYDARGCALESIRNRPEYADSYKQWV